MNIKRLDLTNFRGIKHLELEFSPGINVIAGKNGVGKSGILESMAVLLLKIAQETGHSRERRNFSSSDVRFNSDFLQAALSCEVDEVPFRVSLSRSREQVAVEQQEKVTREEVRQGERNTYDSDKPASKRVFLHDEPQFALLPDAPLPDWNTFKKLNRGEPFLAVYYATKRAYVRDLSATSGRAKLNAYDGALSGNFIDFDEFAASFDFLTSARVAAARSGALLEQFQKAVTHFLPSFSELRVETTETVRAGKSSFVSRLLVRKDGQEFELKQLSDGERGILAIVLDLTRRLVLAHPDHSNPLSEGTAVVLIDEIDLHLHPIWQREILARLEATFPKCQFVLTTHSPQVIGQTLASNLIYLEQHEEGIARRDIGDSFGRDTNWVLQRIMGTMERDRETMEEIELLFQLVEAGDFQMARDKIESLRSQIGEDSELIAATTRIRRHEILKGQKR